MAVLRLAMAPLLSLFILMLSNGLSTTLLTLRLNAAGASSFVIGIMTTCFFGGYVVAAFRAEPFISRVGHIRALACFASGLAVISLLYGIFFDYWLWVILRICAGVATAGVYIVIESWLLVLGSAINRGQILSFYMISLYGAQALGQFLIKTDDSQQPLLLFSIASVLCSLGIIPLAITKVTIPQPDEPSTLSFKKLYKIAPSGMLGCFCAGLILSAIYGLMPLYIINKMFDTANVANYMACIILGGMFLQYPVGRLSDFIERRIVLIFLCALTIFISFAIITPLNSYIVKLALFFIFGGLSFTLYPICISHACDNLDNNDIVAGTQGLVLAYGIGATLGPLIAPTFIWILGNNGLFLYFISVCALLILFFSWRRTRKEALPQEEPFVSMPQTTPILSELDPRGEQG